MPAAAVRALRLGTKGVRLIRRASSGYARAYQPGLVGQHDCLRSVPKAQLREYVAHLGSGTGERTCVLAIFGGLVCLAPLPAWYFMIAIAVLIACGIAPSRNRPTPGERSRPSADADRPRPGHRQGPWVPGDRDHKLPF